MHQVRRGGPRLGFLQGRPRARWSLPPRTGSMQPSPQHFLPASARLEKLWRLTATRKQHKQKTVRYRRPHLGCDRGRPRARWCQPPRAQPLESQTHRFRHGSPNLLQRAADNGMLRLREGVLLSKDAQLGVACKNAQLVTRLWSQAEPSGLSCRLIVRLLPVCLFVCLFG